MSWRDWREHPVTGAVPQGLRTVSVCENCPILGMLSHTGELSTLFARARELLERHRDDPSVETFLTEVEDG